MLPRLQPELLSSPFTFGVLQFFDEVDGPHSSLAIEVPTSVEGVVEVGIVAPNRKPDILADDNRPIAHLLGVDFGGICFIRIHRQFLFATVFGGSNPYAKKTSL